MITSPRLLTRKDILSCRLVCKRLKIAAPSIELSTLLLDAFSRGDLCFARKLLESKKALLELAHDRHRRTPLHLAAKGGHLEAVKFIIDAKLYPIDVLDEHGHTPLFYAAYEGRFKVIAYLLQVGANPNGGRSQLAILEVAQRRSAEFEQCVHLLLSSKASRSCDNSDVSSDPMSYDSTLSAQLEGRPIDPTKRTEKKAKGARHCDYLILIVYNVLQSRKMKTLMISRATKSRSR